MKEKKPRGAGVRGRARGKNVGKVRERSVPFILCLLFCDRVRAECRDVAEGESGEA